MDKSDLNLIKEISRLTLKKGDILVVKISVKVSHEGLVGIKNAMEHLLEKAGLGGEIPVAIFDSNDVELKIVSGSGMIR